MGAESREVEQRGETAGDEVIVAAGRRPGLWVLNSEAFGEVLISGGTLLVEAMDRVSLFWTN